MTLEHWINVACKYILFRNIYDLKVSQMFSFKEALDSTDNLAVQQALMSVMFTRFSTLIKYFCLLFAKWLET